MRITDLIHHDGSALYLSNVQPQLGETIKVYLRVPKSLTPKVVALRMVRDGEPVTKLATKVASRFKDDADDWYEAECLVHNPRTNYRWLVSGGNAGYGWVTQLGWQEHDVNDAADFVITPHKPIANWARKATIYQIFPDRFASSGRTYEIPTWAVPRTWDQHPQGRGPNTPIEYFGGDLWGVLEKLDYIQDLGISCIYFTPIFPATSLHRYDAQSFDEVDPLLGGNEALIALVEAAHSRGMKVIGDITLNHSGDTHKWFQAAVAGDPEYRDFYIFNDELEHGYESWLGVKSLPKFNYQSAALREKLITGPESVIRKWLRAPYNLDGWRVDVANMSGRLGELDMTREVARMTREAVLLEGPDKILIGEHNHDSGPDLDGDGWFGNMNYTAFRNPALMWLVSDEMKNIDEPDYAKVPQGIIPQVSVDGMLKVIRQYSSRMPWRSYSSSWNLLSSHDSPRIRTIVGSRDRQIAAATLMATFPGTPMIFAGDELGVQGLWGEDSRTTHPWHLEKEWDEDLRAKYRTLNNLRIANDALAFGGLRIIHSSDDVVAFLRETDSQRILAIVARTGVGQLEFEIPTWSFTKLQSLFGFEAKLTGKTLTVQINSAGGGIWQLI
ncbi:MAG: glycoside hydrolase family 13 protein [Actinomycetales bacterium]|nr:glycoside hydrolase family 13 protein [Actinomycetales bacterium]